MQLLLCSLPFMGSALSWPTGQGASFSTVPSLGITCNILADVLTMPKNCTTLFMSLQCHSLCLDGLPSLSLVGSGSAPQVWLVPPPSNPAQDLTPQISLETCREEMLPNLALCLFICLVLICTLYSATVITSIALAWGLWAILANYQTWEGMRTSQICS